MILVDDGLATGASMFAAVQALREADPAEIVIAVPAAPESTCREFAGIVDDVVCASMPTPFLAVGESFWDFRQVSDEEVRELLATPTTGVATATIRIRETPAEVIGRAAVDAPSGCRHERRWKNSSATRASCLIGESSHGTHEFYEARAEITKWLIEEKGFCAVAAEADWPDAYRVNRYVRGLGDDDLPNEALSWIRAFPGMDVAQRRGPRFRRLAACPQYHAESTGGRQTGFYGLDLYSLHRSMQEVIRYLENVDPARRRGRGNDTHASTTPPPTTARPMGSPPRSAPACPANARPSSNWSRCSATHRITRAATACSPRTSCSMPSRMRRPCATPRSTTARCSAGASRRGICATSTWRRPWRRCWPTSTATTDRSLPE